MVVGTPEGISLQGGRRDESTWPHSSVGTTGVTNGGPGGDVDPVGGVALEVRFDLQPDRWPRLSNDGSTLTTNRSLKTQSTSGIVVFAQRPIRRVGA